MDSWTAVGGATCAAVAAAAALWRASRAQAADAECASSRARAAEEESGKYMRMFPDVAHLTPAGLRALSGTSRVTLVDVRSREEHAVSTLPGAVWVGPDGDLPADPDVAGGSSSASDDHTIVTFCTVGLRSSLAARRFSRAVADGTPVYSMAGVLAWAHDGGGFVDPTSGARTKRLHLFGESWRRLAPTDAGLEIVVFNPTSSPGALCRAVLGVVKSWATGGGWPTSNTPKCETRRSQQTDSS